MWSNWNFYYVLISNFFEFLAFFQGVYGDNGSLMYHHSYGYGPYGPYSPAASPVPSMGNDGQLYGPQHYQYPPYFQPLTPTSGPYTPSPTTVPQSQGDISTSAATEQKPLPVETANPNGTALANGGGTKGNNGAAPIKSTYQNSAYGSNVSYARGAMPGHIPTSGYQDPRYGFDGLRSSFPWSDGPLYSDGQSRLVNSSTINSSITNANNMPSSRNPNYRPNTHYVVSMPSITVLLILFSFRTNMEFSPFNIIYFLIFCDTGFPSS